MSKQSRQLLRGATKQRETRIIRRKSFIWLCLFTAAGLVCVGEFIWFHLHQQNSGPVSTTRLTSFQQPKTLNDLLALSPSELEQCDIARMNLLCAEGLSGTEDLNVDESLTRLDQWAQHIQSETARNFHHFKEDPAYYYNSENFYKMLMMAVVLYEDYGIRYDPKWIAAPETIRHNDHFFADSRDILIHGLINSPHMGTCSSMPVLYIALGCRLGYCRITGRKRVNFVCLKLVPAWKFF